MLKLDNVSVYSLGLGLFSPQLEKLADENGVVNVQQFIDMVEQHPEVKNIYTKEIANGDVLHRLREIERYVKRYQKKGKEPEIYSVREYKDKSLEYNDSLNKFSVLPLGSPLKPYYYNGCRNCSMNFIKEVAGFTNSGGDNYLKQILRNVGDKNFASILRAIDMYTEQIERQGKLTDDRESNLFYLDYKDRKECVEDHYAEIVSYLLYSDKELLWGKLSDNMKKDYLASCFSKSEDSAKTRERLATHIARYTTLPELQKLDEGKYKVLKRFMIN